MSLFGDVEAHRRILLEMAVLPTAVPLTAYFKAAVQSASCTEAGLREVCCFPEDEEFPELHLDVLRALLCLTADASAAHPSFSERQRETQKLLACRRASLDALNRRVYRSRAYGCGDAQGNEVAVRATTPGSTAVPCEDDAGTAPKAPTRAPPTFHQLEQSSAILGYYEAYTNYLLGFSQLWCELFASANRPDTAVRVRVQDGADAGEGDAPFSRATAAASAGVERGTSPHSAGGSSSPENFAFWQGEQALARPPRPSHLYALPWGDILTPPRRAWGEGLQRVMREILLRIVRREVPVALYVVFVLYAHLSHSVLLLQTLAEIVEYSSQYIEVLYCVRVMRRSSQIQREMADLQMLWLTFARRESGSLCDPAHCNLADASSKMVLTGQEAMRDANISLINPSAPARVADDTLRNRRPGAVSTSKWCRSRNRVCDTPSLIRLEAPEKDEAEGCEIDGTVPPPHSCAVSPADHAHLSLEGAAGPSRCSAESSAPVPPLHSRCCLSWMLQHTFWAMHRRCAILFESCLGVNALMPTVCAPNSGTATYGEEDRPGSPWPFAIPSRGVRHRDGTVAGRKGGSNNINASPARSTPPAHGAATPAVAFQPSPPTLMNCGAVAVHGCPAGSQSVMDGPMQSNTMRGDRLPSSASPIAVIPATWEEGDDRSPERYTLEASDMQRQGSEKEVTSTPTEGLGGRKLTRQERRCIISSVSAPHDTPLAGADAHTGAKGGTAAAASSSSAPLALSPCSLPVRDGSLLSGVNSGAPFYLNYGDLQRHKRSGDTTSISIALSRIGAPFVGATTLRGPWTSHESCRDVLLDVLRSIPTCHARYPATLVILTDNTHRPGRVCWNEHRLTLPSASRAVDDARRGLRPWVVNAVIPPTRLSTDGDMRSRQEVALLHHIVFQLAGANGADVSFSSANSIFYVRNGGPQMDAGRLYFALHLRVDGAPTTRSGDAGAAAMKAERSWAFEVLEGLHKTWAMHSMCAAAQWAAHRIATPAESS